MRTLRALPIFAIVLLMTACVPSLNPLYTKADLIFEPALVGTWVNQEDGHQTIWTVTKSGEGYEMVDVEEDEDPAKFDVRMVKLGDQTFLDLYPKQEINNGLYQLHIIRAHIFMKVALTGDSLVVTMLDQEWLKKALNGEETAIGHLILEDGGVLLTAPTADLQEFIVKSYAHPDAFGEPVFFARRKE